MLDDYLRVRGIGDLVAGGTLLVVVTMVAHFWGYAALVGSDVLIYVGIQDYLRLSVEWFPLVVLYIALFKFGGLTISALITKTIKVLVYEKLGWGEANEDDMTETVVSISNKFKSNISLISKIFNALLNTILLIIILPLAYLYFDPFNVFVWAYIVFIVTFIFAANTSFLSIEEQILISIYVVMATSLAVSYYSGWSWINITFISILASIVSYRQMHFIAHYAKKFKDVDTVISNVLALSLAVIVFSFGFGIAQSYERTLVGTKSVAVHVHYSEEPVEGTILINLSNTLLLSEPGSTNYTAIGQSEIRSIDRLDRG